MATDLEDVLFPNILENLADVTLHSELSVFIDSSVARSYLVPEPFTLTSVKPPYIQLVPGEQVFDEDHNQQRVLPITAYVVGQAYDLKLADRDKGLMAITTTTHRATLIGDLCKRVREALVRVDPYNDAAHVTTVRDYVTQAGVTSCVCTSVGAFVPLPIMQVDDEEVVERIHYARPVNLLYYMVEA